MLLKHIVNHKIGYKTLFSYELGIKATQVLIYIIL